MMKGKKKSYYIKKFIFFYSFFSLVAYYRYQLLKLFYFYRIYKEASEVMEKKKFKKLELKAKEGLSLINGTQFLTTFAIMSYLRVENLLKTFDLIYCLSFELLGGTMDIIDERLFKGDKVGEDVIKRLKNYIIGKWLKKNIKIFIIFSLKYIEKF